jgi:hypothetical protein
MMEVIACFFDSKSGKSILLGAKHLPSKFCQEGKKLNLRFNK